ncbi:MAG: excinuclease ABC subunit UvrC [Chloroflexota bacterium]
MASPELEQKVDSLPDRPGVYCFRDASGKAIYVGKAQSLRNRVRSYLQSPDQLASKTRRMVEKAVELDVTVTSTPVEALILECNLIKELRPRYNVMLRDDKSYPFIKVTVQEEWPRVYFTRSVIRDGARYFGPFTDAKSVRQTLDTLNRLFPFRSCHRTITGKDPRACLAYHIHRCTAPCIGVADQAEYLQAIQQVVLFLEGKQERIIEDLRKQMERAAEELNFEHAARLRDRIRSRERIVERQKITSEEDPSDRDVIGLATGNGVACAQLFFIRNGKLVGSEHFALEGTEDEIPAPVLASFLQQFYDSAAYVPPQILLQEEIDDSETLAEWLTERRGSRVRLAVPRRGQKSQLVKLAMENATQQLEMLKLRWLNDTQRTTGALLELRDALQLPSTPHRIECYDISNIQGTSAVGSMVVFEGGQAKNSDYRRFKIKTVEGANDFAMMQEVLRRRFKRAVGGQLSAVGDSDDDVGAGGSADLAQGVGRGPVPRRPEVGRVTRASTASRPALPEDAPDSGLGEGEGSQSSVLSPQSSSDGWAALPDLVIVDGGKGQLKAALEVLDDLGLASLPAVGLAKENEEIFQPGVSQGLMLPRTSQALYLVQRIRDEAHRFAITYHRNVRSKRSFGSALDEVPGIGPRRKQALIKQFGSVKAVREASLEELLAVPGMNRQAAAKIKEML